MIFALREDELVKLDCSGQIVLLCTRGMKLHELSLGAEFDFSECNWSVSGYVSLSSYKRQFSLSADFVETSFDSC